MTDTDDLYDDEIDDLDDAPDYTDADAFFAAEAPGVEPAVLLLYGQEYVLPTRVPLAFSLLAERHAAEESMDALKTVLTPVFGEGALDEWMRRGMNERQLSIVLIWATQNMSRPRSFSLEEAARRYEEEEARGKALPNRAARRAAASGRRS